MNNSMASCTDYKSNISKPFCRSVFFFFFFKDEPYNAFDVCMILGQECIKQSIFSLRDITARTVELW